MEKVNFLPNGQWSLEKSREKGALVGPYVLEHSNPEHKYSGKNLNDMMSHTIKTASSQPHKALKMDINPKTNKQEPHIMLHRGMPDSRKALDSERHGNQKFEVTDNHVIHHGTGVHTANYNVAEEYAGGYGGGEGKANVHSFWVPISDVMDNLSFSNTKDRKLSHGDHVVVGPGKHNKISEEEKAQLLQSMNKPPTSNDYLNAHKFRSKIAGMDSDKHDNYSKNISDFSDNSIKELSSMHSNPRVHSDLNDEEYKNQVINHLKNLK